MCCPTTSPSSNPLTLPLTRAPTPNQLGTYVPTEVWQTKMRPLPANAEVRGPVVEPKSRLSEQEIEKSNFALYRSIGYGIKVGCWRAPRRVWPGVRVSQKKLWNISYERDKCEKDTS